MPSLCFGALYFRTTSVEFDIHCLFALTVKKYIYMYACVYIEIDIWLARFRLQRTVTVLFVVAWWTFSWDMWALSYDMWGLVPWPGIEPRPPSLGVWSLSYWTTREIPVLAVFEIPLSPVWGGSILENRVISPSFWEGNWGTEGPESTSLSCLLSQNQPQASCPAQTGLTVFAQAPPPSLASRSCP